MKKVFALFLAVLLIMSLAACGGEKTPPQTDNPGTSAPNTSDTPDTPEPEKPNYPTKSITMIVPFGAGGGTDVMARAIAAAVDLPQSIVITNIEGGGSSIGAMEAYHADPDGYTLFCVGLEPIIAGVYSGTYPEKDSYEKFIPLCSAADDQFIVMVSKASGYQSLEDVVAAAQAAPGKLTCAATGSMSITNAATEMFFDACDIDVQYVPYDGAAKARAAVMGGHNELSVMLVSEATPAIESGDAIPVCVLGSERCEFFPDVPCVSEVGSYDLDVSFHRAFFCTPGTPQEIVDILEEAFQKACESPDVQQTLRDLNYAPNFVNAADLKAVGDIRYQDLKPVFDALLAS